MQNKEETVKEISLKEQLEEVEDKLLRIFLEYNEFSRSVQAEKMRSIKGTTANVYVALLPIFDDLDRAKDTIDDVKDLDSLKEELKLISDKLTKSLKSNGLEQMDVKHQDFNIFKTSSSSSIVCLTNILAILASCFASSPAKDERAPAIV